jgi:hypothetical protein
MGQDNVEECNGDVTRRQWMLGAGAMVSAAVFTHMAGWLPSAQAKGLMETWPWPYEKLDPAETAEIAYSEWYRVYCGAAVISSVFSQLRKKVGEPYKSFPIDAFMFLEGGMVSWGTICGSIAGANIVANLIIGPRLVDDEATGHLISGDILDWYCNASLPLYKPKYPKVKERIEQTISESPLCHISVGKWMAKTDKPIDSPERKDRCARTAASVAFRVVELLNQWKDDKYEAKGEWKPISEYGINAQPNCMECHSDSLPEAPVKKS